MPLNRIRTVFALAAAVLALAALPGGASAPTYYAFESFAWTGNCMDNYRG